MIWEKLDPSLLFIGLKAREYTDIFRTVGGALIEHGYAINTYIDALTAREQTFPTGLDIQGTGIAIPHTDARYVNREGIAIATLDQPVTFFQMGTDCDPVPVRLVFMLAVTDPKKQIDWLLKILDIIHDPCVLNRLLLARNHRDIIEILKTKEAAL